MSYYSCGRRHFKQETIVVKVKMKYSYLDDDNMHTVMRHDEELTAAVEALVSFYIIIHQGFIISLSVILFSLTNILFLYCTALFHCFFFLPVHSSHLFLSLPYSVLLIHNK